MLEDLLDPECGTIRLSEEVEANGVEFLASACRFGLEGKQLDRLKAASPSARGIGKNGLVWVRRMLAAEIAHRGWTHDDKLRHASFKGLREKMGKITVFRLS